MDKEIWNISHNHSRLFTRASKIAACSRIGANCFFTIPYKHVSLGRMKQQKDGRKVLGVCFILSTIRLQYTARCICSYHNDSLYERKRFVLYILIQSLNKLQTYISNDCDYFKHSVFSYVRYIECFNVKYTPSFPL